MSEYSQFKKKIEHRAEILEETIQELAEAGQAEGPAAQRWRGYLGGVHESLRDPLLKIAVAGSVKSGKSTLINAMAGDDLLKRGAGIITSFITRVVTDGDPGGWVELKSWPRINAEVNASLRMLPVFAADEAEQSFDIRLPGDRDRIAGWLDRMKSEWLQSRGNLDPHFMFLERSLQGFGLIRDEIGEEANRTGFDKANLLAHRLYVGEESRSVYVRDIELNYPVPWLGDRIELADCQGSDSPNPAHFELLQQYLLASHFVIYVIGSRTGLREADFKLLDFLKTLRMFPQTLFVLNLDFDIHNDREELDQSADRVRSELGWVVPNPKLFSFSALFQLLRQLGDKAPKPERRHMKLWKETKALTKATETGFGAFKKELEDLICSRRSHVLLGCGLSRLGMVAANISDTVRLRRSVLEAKIDDIGETADKLRSRHAALQSTLANLADTVSGLNQALRGEVAARVDSFFDSARGPIVREALDMVEHYTIDLKSRDGGSDYRRLIREYYGFYLEFRRNLSRFLVEKINLRIMEFAKEEEFLLRERIRGSSHALWDFFDSALADYRRDFLGAKAPAGSTRCSSCEPDPAAMAVPPSFSTFLERGSLGRGILFLKFGLGSFATVLSGIKAKMRKSLGGPEGKSEAELFSNGLTMARDEARSELLRAFADFRESIKAGYFFRIADEWCIFLLKEFRERAEMAQVDFADLIRQSELRGEERRSAVEAVVRADRIASAMIEELEELRRAVQTGISGLAEDATQAQQALQA